MDWQVTRCSGEMQWFLQCAWRAAQLLICMAFLAGLYIKFNVDTSSFSKTHDVIWLKSQIIRETNHHQKAPALAPVAVVTWSHNTTGGCIGLACAPPPFSANGLTDASAISPRFRAPAPAPVAAVVTSDHNTTGGCIGLACAPPASLAATKGDGLTDANIASRFRARVDRVREACEAYRGPEISPEIQFRFLYFSEKYNLMVCATPKVRVPCERLRIGSQSASSKGSLRLRST